MHCIYNMCSWFMLLATTTAACLLYSALLLLFILYEGEEEPLASYRFYSRLLFVLVCFPIYASIAHTAQRHGSPPHGPPSEKDIYLSIDIYIYIYNVYVYIYIYIRDNFSSGHFVRPQSKTCAEAPRLKRSGSPRATASTEGSSSTRRRSRPISYIITTINRIAIITTIKGKVLSLLLIK